MKEWEGRHFSGFCTNCGQRCHCQKCDDDFYRQTFTERSKQKIVEDFQLGMKGSWDYAVPQNWLEEMMKICPGTSFLNHFVWFYPEVGEGKIFGRPFPLTDTGRQMLKIYNATHGSNYPLI